MIGILILRKPHYFIVCIRLARAPHILSGAKRLFPLDIVYCGKPVKLRGEASNSKFGLLPSSKRSSVTSTSSESMWTCWSPL